MICDDVDFFRLSLVSFMLACRAILKLLVEGTEKIPLSVKSYVPLFSTIDTVGTETP